MSANRALVVGLLSSQARRIAESFPGQGLRFLPREREGELGTLAAAPDHVVLMTKFISHSSWQSVPPEKRVPVAGGLTDLRRTLTKLLRPVALEVTLTVPPAREGEMADFSALHTAEPGSVLFFKRPTHTTRDTFSKQVAASRSYYRLRHGVQSEQRTVDDGVVVTLAAAPQAAQDAPRDVRMTATDEQRHFWSAAYLQLLKALPGAAPDVIAARADEALQQRTARFPTET